MRDLSEDNIEVIEEKTETTDVNPNKYYIMSAIACGVFGWMCGFGYGYVKGFVKATNVLIGGTK